MFVSVQFGYQQSKLFNINCQIAPLLDAIHDGCYKEMHKFMKKREEFFNKEIAALKKKEQGLLKRMEKIDPPKEPQKEEVKV
jgi:mannose/fructose/N-acetylgalactosamine-specific phosphotransferase system component IID